MPDVRWRDDEVATLVALRGHVADVRRVDLSEVSVGHLCPHCGSSEHGRPWARAGGVDVPVSASHAGGWLVTAVGEYGAIGIDIEVVADIERGWDASLVLAPGDSADSPVERAAVWCGKEAVLKATGQGLRVPMSDVRLADWDVRSLPAPQGMCARLVVEQGEELLVVDQGEELLVVE